MISAAEQLFNEFNNYGSLEALIENGETETIYLECKAPSQPKLTQDQRAQLAKAISGFSNTEGGVIIWGMSTTKKKHSGLDVISQIEPIGACNGFAKQVENYIPRATTPSMTACKTKVIVRRKSDSKGIVITYIPKTLGDPVQTIADQNFFFRSGDEFTKAPYELIKRLFTSTQSPDLTLELNDEMINFNLPTAQWEITLTLKNRSSAVAEHYHILLIIENPEVCEMVWMDRMRDQSKINQGMKIFMYDSTKVIHRGLNVFVDDLQIKFMGRKKKLLLSVSLFANKMRARQIKFVLLLNKNNVSVKKQSEEFLY